MAPGTASPHYSSGFMASVRRPWGAPRRRGLIGVPSAFRSGKLMRNAKPGGAGFSLRGTLVAVAKSGRPTAPLRSRPGKCVLVSKLVNRCAPCGVGFRPRGTSVPAPIRCQIGHLRGLSLARTKVHATMRGPRIRHTYFLTGPKLLQTCIRHYEPRALASGFSNFATASEVRRGLKSTPQYISLRSRALS
jgi:hypothetical protein